MRLIAQRFLDGLYPWADGRDDVRALVLVGSYARGTASADSDLDVEQRRRVRADIDEPRPIRRDRDIAADAVDNDAGR
jgi:predicted nucleotidyltransferase